jgi:hypothetical protein
MTEKYIAYVDMLASRDQVLTTLAVMAMATILAWQVLETLPNPWRARLSRLYLWGGTAFYALLIIALFFWKEGL